MTLGLKEGCYNKKLRFVSSTLGLEPKFMTLRAVCCFNLTFNIFKERFSLFLCFSYENHKKGTDIIFFCCKNYLFKGMQR